jgi:cell division protein FtsB
MAMLILLGLIVFSENGFLELNHLKEKKERIVQQNLHLTKKNYRLYRTIERLKTDPSYVEYIARRELGMVGTRQLIFKYRNGPVKNN